MTSVQVGTLAAALGLVDRLKARLLDFRPLWDRIEKNVLPEAQKRQFETFGNVHPATAKARAKREGYYGKNAPRLDATATGPRFRWTGALEESTVRITERGPLLARIDPDRNYRGPIRGQSVFSQIVGRAMPEARVWNREYIERGIEREMEKWVAEEVARLT